MKKTPLTHDGKDLKFEETFRSAFPKPTRELAENVLEEIRNQHNSAYGWVEIDSRIEETPAGFVAVRHHAQYR